VPELWQRLHPCFRLLSQLPDAPAPRKARRANPDHRDPRSGRARCSGVRGLVDGVARASTRRDPGQFECVTELRESLGRRHSDRTTDLDDRSVRVLDAAIRRADGVAHRAASRKRYVDRPFSVALAIRDSRAREPGHADRVGFASLDGDLARNRNRRETVLI